MILTVETIDHLIHLEPERLQVPIHLQSSKSVDHIIYLSRELTKILLQSQNFIKYGDGPLDFVQYGDGITDIILYR